MPDVTLPALFGLLLAASVLSLAILWIISRIGHGPSRAHSAHDMTDADTAHFLFHDDALSDLDTPVEHLPGATVNDIRTWADLRMWLGTRFGPLPKSLQDMSPSNSCELVAVAPDDNATLAITALRNARHVRLSDPTHPNAVAQHRARNLEALVARYTTVLNKAPCAIRILDPVAGATWQNTRFTDFTEEERDKLIDAAQGATEPVRVCLPGERAGQDRHYELENIHRGEVSILYVTDVTQVAQAELVRREFIQTLTKTFANLTTGLAVFDRHRQLALFNPALLDLTGLSAPFLSAQPPLTQFFDELRDKKVLPEPKNYGDWRQQIDDMITSASDGLYLEDWSLPNGATFRVTGRPHPDGAIAFLFEDISDEVTLTRRFRSQIEMRQAALDTCDQAMAVFGPNNIVLLCNQPCCQLLNIDPDASFAEMSVKDFVSAGRSVLPDPAFWSEAEQAILERGTIDRVLRDTKDQPTRVSVRSLPGNSTMISFLSAATWMTPEPKDLEHIN